MRWKARRKEKIRPLERDGHVQWHTLEDDQDEKERERERCCIFLCVCVINGAV